ncbi:unnamed protein product [Cuscuta campestris]|uniref:Transcription factor Iwr1 domain-containing protein n=1 Tax=Cuscuta campestris TaxID=132261 RepID=A0A484NJC6_9ASTE|nr:unnamed protein product [Cuscuta campestris]
MAEVPEGDVKPVIVRVKRKATQSRLDALWLEINERPFKRPLIDFEKLSVSDSSSSKVEGLKTKKVLVQHVETITSSEVTADLVRSFVHDSASSLIKKEKLEERRHTFKACNRVQRQGHLLSKAKQTQEDLSKNARFEQIWKSRREKNDDVHNEALNEICRLYNVVRVDTDESRHEIPVRDEELEDHKMMSQYLPLLREFMPSAAEEIESDVHEYISKRASSDGYVYDFYAIKNDAETAEEETSSHFPLVQVDDEDDEFYDGPDDEDYETDDSNDENNPRNDYPEEASSSDDEDEGKSQSSKDDQSEAESESSSNESRCDASHDGEALDGRDIDPYLEDDVYSVDDGELYDDEDADYQEYMEEIYE